MNSEVRVCAPAKINLALEVLGKRTDGYHDIATVMTTVNLLDQVTMRPADTLSVSLHGSHAGDIDPENDLAGNAAKTLADIVGRSPNVQIEIKKMIPSPGGLGGGSSDAAAVLRGLDQMWELNWSVARLAEIGAMIGSDVPFFVHGGTAYCTGRGEVVEPLRDIQKLLLLVLLPPIPAQRNKTTEMFDALHAHDFSNGHKARRLAHRISRGAPPPANDLTNAFESVIERMKPELVAHYGAYATVSAPRLHLCGAGPAVYLLVHQRAKLSELRNGLEHVGATVFEAHTITRSEATKIEIVS